MNCGACGYSENSDSSKEFSQIYSSVKFEIDNPKECEHGDEDYEDRVKVNLYACPICGTVKMQIIGG